jgi:asparagine synthase (glutamine-hydrolysing)
MKAIFAARLIPGVRARTLSDQDASWLTRRAGQVSSGRASSDSFVYVRGPNASAFVTVDGRYTVAISGHYSAPNVDESPAEWIMRAFQKRFAECFTELNGSWRLLIIDNDRGTAVAATDRMGSQRICFAEGPGGRLTLGHDNEIVSRIQGSSPSISVDSVFQYFYFHFIPSPATLFRAIHCIPPAEFLTWSAQGSERRRYWNPRFASAEPSQRRVSPGDLLDALDESVRAACSTRRTATFLSGGLDSSTVLGLATRHLPGAVSPYTIGFDEPTYDETRYARIAADHFGVSLNRREVTPADVVDAIEKVASAYDEPFGNSSAIPTYFCATAAASAGETRILAGDGGDELFAGNQRYRTQQVFEKYLSLPSLLRSRVIEPLFLNVFFSTGFFPIRKVRRYVEQARLPMPDRLQTYNYLHAHGVDSIFTPRFIDAVDATSPLRHLRAVYAESATDCLVDKMLYLDWKLTLADNDLRKVTTMCESAGIAVQFPMLDNRLIDLACEIPGRVKMRGGNLRDFFKKSVRSLLPDAIINKTKHGFGLPFGPWFARSKPLRDHMVTLLDSLGRRDIVRRDYVDFIRKATLEEHAGYYGEMIWLMCVLESWLAARAEWRSYRL